MLPQSPGEMERGTAISQQDGGDQQTYDFSGIYGPLPGSRGARSASPILLEDALTFPLLLVVVMVQHLWETVVVKVKYDHV